MYKHTAHKIQIHWKSDVQVENAYSRVFDDLKQMLSQTFATLQVASVLLSFDLLGESMSLSIP